MVGRELLRRAFARAPHRLITRCALLSQESRQPFTLLSLFIDYGLILPLASFHCRRCASLLFDARCKMFGQRPRDAAPPHGGMAGRQQAASGVAMRPARFTAVSRRLRFLCNAAAPSALSHFRCLSARHNAPHNGVTGPRQIIVPLPAYLLVIAIYTPCVEIFGRLRQSRQFNAALNASLAPAKAECLPTGGLRH